MMSAKDCLQVGCKKCSFCDAGPTTSIFKPGCPFFTELTASGARRYTGGVTMPPYPVMHGAMFTEVQTLEMCYNTKCVDCAFTLHLIDEKLPISKANCNHKTMLYFAKSIEIKSTYKAPEVDAKELLSDYTPSSNRTYYYRARASLKACGREKVCHRDNCYITDDLQVHHIDGDISNNHADNLEYLCVECHSIAHPDRADLILSRRG